MQADAIEELAPPPPKAAQTPPRKRGPRKPDDWLGTKLRELYDTYEAEPLPNDLQALLDKLDGPSEEK